MIIAKPIKGKTYNLAFTIKKEVPDKFLKSRKPQLVLALINNDSVTVELQDVLIQPFTWLPLLNFTIKIGTDRTAKEIQQGLIKRFGEGIKRQTIYIISYRIANEEER